MSLIKHLTVCPKRSDSALGHSETKEETDSAAITRKRCKDQQHPTLKPGASAFCSTTRGFFNCRGCQSRIPLPFPYISSLFPYFLIYSSENPRLRVSATLLGTDKTPLTHSRLAHIVLSMNVTSCHL